jgi:hypothetical protein
MVGWSPWGAPWGLRLGRVWAAGLPGPAQRLPPRDKPVRGPAADQGVRPTSGV